MSLTCSLIYHNHTYLSKYLVYHCKSYLEIMSGVSYILIYVVHVNQWIVYNILPFVNCKYESVFNLLTMESVKV